jgi:DNA-binding Xre family transcriptional regulator
MWEMTPNRNNQITDVISGCINLYQNMINQGVSVMEFFTGIRISLSKIKKQSWRDSGMGFQKIIKDRVIQKNITQTQLATITGTQQTQISNYLLHNKGLSIASLQKIITYLGFRTIFNTDIEFCLSVKRISKHKMGHDLGIDTAQLSRFFKTNEKVSINNIERIFIYLDMELQ